MGIIRKVCCNGVGIGNSWKVDGNKLEISWNGLEWIGMDWRTLGA